MGAVVSAPMATSSVAVAGTQPSWAVLNNSIGGTAAFLAKERIQCLCEGGSHCTKEDWEHQRGTPAFLGLHSNWVTPEVLAMARPWQENVVRHSLVQRFQEAQIGMILNLQEVGEHAHCGRGVLPNSGFSYDPESFMAAGIGFFNFSWRDMGCPSLHKMMDIVQVMAHVTRVEKRKIAVHCHAGLGRTGLSIACYLVFLGECTPAEAILLTRKGRPGALQTKQQVRFVEVFLHYLQHLR
ncbi:hypothetical protein WJX72_003967 [[Myrmecia] bisecta]|uniref:Uncharacterized protein n=1 Tax=[Myrmecia] bisecta TaxID=41462 RepID=A0AAW1PDG0_9CHLO